MNTKSTYKRSMHALKQMLYWTLVGMVALFVFIHFLSTSGVGGHGPAKIQRLLEGTAYRPYTYRVLLPVVATLLSGLLDKELALRIGIKAELILGDTFFQKRLNGSLYPSQVVLILGMMYLSLFGFAVTIWHLLKDLGYEPWVRYIMPPVLVAGCMLFSGFGYIYDFTSLFLFSLTLLFILRRQWIAFVCILALGTLNKETAILVYPVFALFHFQRMPRRIFITLTVLQIGIYGLIQGFIRYVYRSNPGQSIEWHLHDQILAFRQTAANYPLLFLYGAAGLAIVAFLITYRWNKKPDFLRVALTILPLFVILYLLWGYPFEIRAMLEVYPIVALLLLPAAWLDSDRRVTTKPETPILNSA